MIEETLNKTDITKKNERVALPVDDGLSKQDIF